MSEVPSFGCWIVIKQDVEIREKLFKNSEKGVAAHALISKGA